ncbi:hypothetical protein EKD04_011790 [Chloroflexales bacterium ZM16-3]|nr:hypothetical protein [Chloroflexales bacterium ZM16-3]
MPKGSAARVTDGVAHAPPGTLTGVGSPSVRIGKRPAWRGIPTAAVSGLTSAKQASEARITAAEAATAAAAGTPGFPAAKASEQALKTAEGLAMGALVMATAGPSDIHTCGMPLPIPPHGPGVVINGSTSVFIEGLPACRVGDTVLEALGPPDTIIAGEQSVIIGG